MPLVFKKIRDIVRHGLVIQTMLDLLRRLGVEVTPYYLMREAIDPSFAPPQKTNLPDPTFRFLDESEIEKVAALPESRLTEEEARRKFERNQLCFGALLDGDLAACVWVELNEMDFDPCRRKLADNEAYLFGARTARRWRGHDLSPLMRRLIYKELAQRGRTHCYSISYVFNTPAIRFKRKLRARHDKLYLYVNLWGCWRRNWLLRDYA